jgi:hypothetical protein
MGLLPVVQYKQENNTPTAYFTPVYFTPRLALTPLTNLHHSLICAVIYRLTPFGRLLSIILTPYLWWEYFFFIYALLRQALFQEGKCGEKQWLGLRLFSNANAV